MAIHHDKTVYGKLAPEREELSAEQLAEMVEELNRSRGGEEDGDGAARKEKIKKED